MYALKKHRNKIFLHYYCNIVIFPSAYVRNESGPLRFSFFPLGCCSSCPYAKFTSTTIAPNFLPPHIHNAFVPVKTTKKKYAKHEKRANISQRGNNAICV